jgi:hypothetical protein
MDLLQDERELEQIAEYHTLRDRVRAWGRGSIVFGLLNLAIGAYYLQFSPINLGLVGIALFMLVEGVWFTARPTAAGVLVDGVTLLLLALWNLFIAALALLVGEPPPLWALLFGALCLAFAVHRFVSYPRAQELFGRSYSEDELARMDELIRYVTTTKPKEAADIITFQAKSFVQQREWRALLSPGAALFVDMLSKRVVVARKEDVTFEQTGKVLLGGTLKATFRAREHTWNGLISPAAFAKYLAWKLEGPAAAPAPETQAAPEGPTDAFKAGQHDFHA